MNKKHIGTSVFEDVKRWYAKQAWRTSVCSKFSVTQEELKERHRGGDVSDARKTLAYIAAKEYRALLHAVAEYLGVGRTAASSLSRQG
jgi:hypothetical protein